MDKHMDLNFNIKLSKEDLTAIALGLSNLIANDNVSINNFKELLRTKNYRDEAHKKQYERVLNMFEITKKNYTRVLELIQSQYHEQKNKEESQ